MMPYIFICFSQNDFEYVQKLAKEMQAQGCAVWYSTHIDYGNQWPSLLQEKVDNCAAFILVMTSHAYKSKWVQNELNRAQRKDKPIFPLLLEGDGPWLSGEAIQYLDVRDGGMPPPDFIAKLAKITAAVTTVSSATVSDLGFKWPWELAASKDNAKLREVIQALKHLREASGKELISPVSASLRVGNVSVSYPPWGVDAIIQFDDFQLHSTLEDDGWKRGGAGL